MVEGLEITFDFDPYTVPIPWESERENLVRMFDDQRALLFHKGNTYIILQYLDAKTVALPFCVGELDDVIEIMKIATEYAIDMGAEKCWIEGRAGWEKLLKEHYEYRVHSVCFELTGTKDLN